MSNNRWAIQTGAALVAIFATFAGMLWWIGLIPIQSAHSSDKVIAAILALLGALVTAIVTFVGLLLKRSFDERSLSLLEQEAVRLRLEGERNLALKEDAEKRRDIDTAIRAVSLLGTTDGKEAPSSQKAGALFALVNLKCMDFALALLEKMWPQGEVDSTTACWLIDRALESKSEKTQVSAAATLENNGALLPSDTGLICFPESLHHSWNIGIAYLARESIIHALMLALLSKPRSDLVPWILNSYVVILDGIRLLDPDRRMRSRAKVWLDKIIATYDPQRVIYVEDGYLDIDEIREALDKESISAIKLSTQATNITTLLETWLADGDAEGSPQQ